MGLEVQSRQRPEEPDRWPGLPTVAVVASEPELTVEPVVVKLTPTTYPRTAAQHNKKTKIIWQKIKSLFIHICQVGAAISNCTYDWGFNPQFLLPLAVGDHI